MLLFQFLLLLQHLAVTGTQKVAGVTLPVIDVSVPVPPAITRIHKVAGVTGASVPVHPAISGVHEVP